jgi:hypothetical protein
MRIMIFGVVLVAALMAEVRPSPAEVVYPWCAFYGSSTRNCGFVSYVQCRGTASSFACRRNPRYDAPLQPGDRKVRAQD